jgi:hypothetical protein
MGEIGAGASLPCWGSLISRSRPDKPEPERQPKVALRHLQRWRPFFHRQRQKSVLEVVLKCVWLAVTASEVPRAWVKKASVPILFFTNQLCKL